MCRVSVTVFVTHCVPFCVSFRFCLYLAFSACDSDTIRDLRWCYRLHAVRPAKESWCCCAGDSLLSAFQLLILPLQSAEGGRRGSQSDSLSFPLLTTCDKSWHLAQLATVKRADSSTDAPLGSFQGVWRVLSGQILVRFPNCHECHIHASSSKWVGEHD